MKNSGATWKVWSNEVPLNRMWLDMRTLAPAPYNQLNIVNADGWDDYPSHRAELRSYLKTQNIGNVVAITGDLHAFRCGVIRDNPDPAVGAPVAVDFVTAGISSSSFNQYPKAGAADSPLAPLFATPQIFDQVMQAHNPYFAYVDHDAQGYAVAAVMPQHFTVVFTTGKPSNGNGTKPAASLAKRTRSSLAAGSTSPTVGDNVA